MAIWEITCTAETLYYEKSRYEQHEHTCIVESKNIINALRTAELQTEQKFPDTRASAIQYKRLDAPPQKEYEPQPGIVYLIRGAGLYKIGMTTGKLAVRFSAICNMSPIPLELVAHIYSQDAAKTERELHNRFSAQRQHGEWFALSPADVDYIKSL